VYNPTDNVILDNENGTCILIHTAISEDRNVVEKGNEEFLNHENLTTTKQASGVKKKILVIIVQLEASQGHLEII
jgi:hypothetical protein